MWNEDVAWVRAELNKGIKAGSRAVPVEGRKWAHGSGKHDIKLYRPDKHPVIRGTAYCAFERMGYLWTKGFVPRLRTYPGWEVPNPLCIQIDRGEADLHRVMQDVMGLTKVNFNACVFGDGWPVTLKFANAVGEILTAAPVPDLPPLPFRYYI